jgi:hypothetical protein
MDGYSFALLMDGSFFTKKESLTYPEKEHQPINEWIFIYQERVAAMGADDPAHAGHGGHRHRIGMSGFIGVQ